MVALILALLLSIRSSDSELALAGDRGSPLLSQVSSTFWCVVLTQSYTSGLSAAQFGGIVWPDTLLEHPLLQAIESNQRITAASMCRYYPHLDARQINRAFAELGSIPLTKRDAIAVRVVTARRGEVINNVPMVKHVTFFESVKLRDQPTPIQKMVTTPIMVRQQAVGVVEISRKGTSSGTAGPDFTEADLRRASEIFDLIGPYLAEARPADF